MTRHYRHTLEFFQTCEKREKYYCFVFLLFVFAYNKDENLWALDVQKYFVYRMQVICQKKVNRIVVLCRNRNFPLYNNSEGKGTVQKTNLKKYFVLYINCCLINAIVKIPAI